MIMSAGLPNVPFTNGDSGRSRCFAFFLSVLTIALAHSSYQYYVMQRQGGGGWMDAVTVLFIFVLTLFFGMFIGSSLVGFAMLLLKHDPNGIIDVVEFSKKYTTFDVKPRTAIVICNYNESPSTVMSSLESVYCSLRACGHLSSFRFHILSDTTDDEIADMEVKMYDRFCRKFEAHQQVFYRRRENNTGRKQGNMTDFVANWGAYYTYLIILDVDSMITGKRATELVRLMDVNDKAGAIQLPLMLYGGSSIFARMHKMMSLLIHRAMFAGFSYWMGPKGRHLDHNVIVRMSAYREVANVPSKLNLCCIGRELSSKDAIWGALMLQKNWQIWMYVPHEIFSGSYEMVPPNYLEFAARDKRWCQGDMQNFRLCMAMSGGFRAHLHLITSSLLYICNSLICLLMTWKLIIASLQLYSWEEAIDEYPRVTPPPFGLIEFAAGAAPILFLSSPMIIGPYVLMSDERSHSVMKHGGKLRYLISVVVAMLFHALLSPSLMAIHLVFTCMSAVCCNISWSGQNRFDSNTSFVWAFRAMWWVVGMGMLLVMWAVYVEEHVMAVCPFSLIALVVPLVVISSSPTIGKMLHEKLRLFPTDEEVAGDRVENLFDYWRKACAHYEEMAYELSRDTDEVSQASTASTEGAAGGKCASGTEDDDTALTQEEEVEKQLATSKSLPDCGFDNVRRTLPRRHHPVPVAQLYLGWSDLEDPGVEFYDKV
eukprot:GHVU01092576.1.p1 GENE.GHVU01092576.1~~GHVU01092576.1.p1  ORF type:complete len:710 (+),score=60.88 GHVU01092576.1:5480-7609(+)